jgi:hypothetical protein
MPPATPRAPLSAFAGERRPGIGRLATFLPADTYFAAG